MSSLAIIGTAGRASDGDAFKREPRLWRTMVAVSQIVTTILKPDRLVSGSAAVSDHLAVLLYLDGTVPHLTLHMPAEWTGHGFKEVSFFSSRFDPGRTSNWYHSLFSEWRGVSSLDEIQRAIEKGAEVKTGAGGFKERNTDIAREADALLAFTFGEGARLKGEDEVPRRGGTLDTWDKWMARRAAAKADTGAFGRTVFPAYHYCLNQHKLFSL